MRKMTTGWRLGAMVLAVGLVAVACGGRDDSGTSGGDGASTTAPAQQVLADPADCTNYKGTTGADGATIKIGGSLPQSGLFKVFDKVRVGTLAYFDFANAGGGVQGKQLELTSLDDAYLPERTRANAETLTTTSARPPSPINVMGSTSSTAHRFSPGSMGTTWRRAPPRTAKEPCWSEK